MPSLRALECLVAVADSGSITQAARLLYSSQPAVSHQLAALEREAGTALILREARGVRLTPAGRAAVVGARKAVEAADSAMRAARAAGEADGGSLRLACAQSLVSVLAPVLGHWHRTRPDVAVSVRESTSPGELHGLLDADDADLVLMPGGAPDRFRSTVVAEEEVVLVAPTDHPLAGLASVSLDDLDGVGLVHFASDNGLGVWLDRHLADAGVRVEPVVRTSVTTAVPQLAAAGLGVAVCPASAVSPGLDAAVRSFTPRWTRTLVALTPGAPDALAARFIADLVERGVPVPRAGLSPAEDGG